MKILCAILLLCVSVAGAQTNFISYLHFNGKDYFNVKIVSGNPAYAVLETDSEIFHAPMSNLPPALQKQFNYSPENASNFLAQEKQKIQNAHAQWSAREAAAQKYFASLVGSNQIVRVERLLDEHNARGVLCEADGKEIIFANLPESVKSFLRQKQQLTADIANYQDRIDRFETRTENAINNTPDSVMAAGDAAYVNSTMNSYQAQINQTSQMISNLDDAKKKLAKMQDDLTVLEIAAPKKTTIIANFTGQSYAPFEIWNYSGMAPEKETPKLTAAE